MKLRILPLLIACLVFLIDATACTTFVLKQPEGPMVFGRNFDFPIGDGHIQINYRGALKTAFIRPPEKPLRWTSKYGSVTFNQAGREFPYGGMNEKGLVIEQMWLQEAAYPPADDRFGLSELQWIQYQLDNSANVQELIDSDTLVRISYMATSYLHFLAADAKGDVAAIEFIDGKMTVHRGEDLPQPALANCKYRHSLEYRQSLQNEDKAVAYNAWTQNSSGRFSKAADLISAYQVEENAVNYAYLILDSVSQQGQTQWSIVYDIPNRTIHYKTLNNPVIRKMEMNRLSFDCRHETQFIPIDQEDANTQNLTVSSNLELIRKVIDGVEFLKNNVPPEFIEASGRYMESVGCSSGED